VAYSFSPPISIHPPVSASFEFFRPSRIAARVVSKPMPPAVRQGDKEDRSRLPSVGSDAKPHPPNGFDANVEVQ